MGGWWMGWWEAWCELLVFRKAERSSAPADRLQPGRDGEMRSQILSAGPPTPIDKFQPRRRNAQPDL
eukprot:211240-Chlamydomonas_euryale.AAC.1